MKKFAAMFLAGVFTLGMFTGCGIQRKAPEAASQEAFDGPSEKVIPVSGVSEGFPDDLTAIDIDAALGKYDEDSVPIGIYGVEFVKKPSGVTLVGTLKKNSDTPEKSRLVVKFEFYDSDCKLLFAEEKGTGDVFLSMGDTYDFSISIQQNHPKTYSYEQKGYQDVRQFELKSLWEMSQADAFAKQEKKGEGDGTDSQSREQGGGNVIKNEQDAIRALIKCHKDYGVSCDETSYEIIDETTERYTVYFFRYDDYNGYYCDVYKEDGKIGDMDYYYGSVYCPDDGGDPPSVWWYDDGPSEEEYSASVGQLDGTYSDILGVLTCTFSGSSVTMYVFGVCSGIYTYRIENGKMYCTATMLLADDAERNPVLKYENVYDGYMISLDDVEFFKE